MAVGVNFILDSWSEDHYVLMPGAVYDGNRWGSRPVTYSPRYPEEDAVAGPLARPLVADIPRLNAEKGQPSRLQLRTGDLAAPYWGYVDPGKEQGYWVAVAEAEPDLLWEVVETMDRSGARFSLLLPGVREKRYSFYQRHIRTDFPSEDRGRVFAAGEVVQMELTMGRIAAASPGDLFDHYFSLWAKWESHAVRRHELPLAAAFDLVEQKRNREDWREEEGLFLTTNLAEGQAREVFQTGWCGGILQEAALLAGQPESLQRARRSLTTISRDALRPNGYLAGKFHLEGGWTADFAYDAEQPWTHRWTLVRRQADALWYLQVAVDRYVDVTEEPPPDAWVQAIRQLAEALCQTWEEEGQLGQFIDIETNEVRLGGSASGALAPAGLVAAGKRFQEKRYGDTARAIAAFYEEHFTRRGITTGGPADAMQSPDSESGASLVESYLALSDDQPDAAYWLECACAAGAQLASWVMPYDFTFPPDSEFGRLSMPSVGSVFANAQNKHSAPGLCTHSGLALFRLYRKTGDIRWLQLVASIARFLPWCVSREDRPIYAFDGRQLPPGWINERVNTSDWDHNVGGVFYGSTWSEVALLLTFVELPSIYLNRDRDVLVSLDHVEATWSDSDRRGVRLHNPTRFPARIRVMAETEKDARTKPFTPIDAQHLPAYTLAPGESREILTSH